MFKFSDSRNGISLIERPNLLSISRFLYGNKSYSSSAVLYSYLNFGELEGVYSANIFLAYKSIKISSFTNFKSILWSLSIDNVYVLNLNRRIDRKLRMWLEFSRFGIQPSFFSAFDSGDKCLDEIYEVHINHKCPQSKYDDHLTEHHKKSILSSLSRGAVAYKISLKEIFEDALSKGFRRIAVFDDDVFFSDFVVKRLGCFVEEQPDDWKIVALGASDYSLLQRIPDVDAVASMDSNGFYTPVPGRTCGSFAMLYDHSVYAELIQGCEYPSGTYDNTVLGAMYAKYPEQSYVLFPNVVTPCVEESDIRDSRNQLEQSQRMFWDLSNYNRWSANLDVFIICDDPGHAESALMNLADANAVTVHFVASDLAKSQMMQTDLSAQSTTTELQSPNKIYELIFAELEKLRSPINVKRFFVFLSDGGVVL